MMKPIRVAMAMAVILLLSSTALADIGQEIASRTLPHLVTIHTFSRQAEETGIGSGFWVGNGEVATNAHVIAGAAWAEIRELDGTLIGTAPYAALLDAPNDLAVLAVPAGHQLGLGIAGEDPGVGAAVWAFGAPLGLEGTVSAGNISAIRDGENRRVLQMTVPISPGSSGGPIVNADGLVVGVTVGMLTEGQNLNFAVPASALRALLGRTRGRLVFPAPGTVGAMLGDHERAIAAQQDSVTLMAVVMGFVGADSVAYGARYTGRLEASDPDVDGPTDFYRFEGRAGQQVDIAAVSSVFDAQVMLVTMDTGPGAEPWTLNDDDGGGGTNARIVAVLPEDGRYFVTVHGYESGEGDYELLLGPGSAGDRWISVGASDEVDVQWDSRTLAKNGANVTVWVRFAYKKPMNGDDGQAYDQMSQKIECDCSGRRIRILATHRSNKGDVVETDNPDEWTVNWQSCVPETWGEAILEATCARR